MRTWNGKAVSPGYAQGAAVLYTAGGAYLVPRYGIDESAVIHEHERLDAAITAARADLEKLVLDMTAEVGATDAGIFATHIALLDDRSFRARIETRIAADAINAEQAVAIEATKIAESLSTLDSEHMRERGHDVRDVGHRVIDRLAPASSRPLTNLPPDAIIVARELLPSETAGLDRQHVRAIVTEEGSKTSHASILAKALGIPSVTGLAGVSGMIRPGEPLLVDGCRGTVVQQPSAESSAAFAEQREAYLRSIAVAAQLEIAACVTTDGTAIELHANLGRVTEAPNVRAHHLAGVGLFRTEILFLDSAAPPTREQHEEAYRAVAAELAGLPLVIRTMDLGGDKQPDFLPPRSKHSPGIGLRGLRLALREIELFRTQLAAILEVSRDHPVRVLFPMVIAGDDLARAIRVLREVAASGGIESLPPIGAMIETPSAVFALPEITRQCEFLSIGTNDLTQFMLAADRDAADLLDDFSILQPPVLRAVSMIVREAAAAGVPVTVCGEAAGDPELAPLLVGLGLSKLSMSPLRAARVRLVLRAFAIDALEQLARDALACESVDGVRRRLDAALSEVADAIGGGIHESDDPDDPDDPQLPYAPNAVQ